VWLNHANQDEALNCPEESGLLGMADITDVYLCSPAITHLRSSVTTWPRTPVEIIEAQQRLSNWGRWGADDEVGAPNMVGPAEVLAAVGEVRMGRIISLSLALDDSGPQRGGRRYNPRLQMTATGTDHVLGHQMSSAGKAMPGGFGFGDDIIDMPTQAGTHVDALSHIFHEGQMYNAVPADDVTSSGAARNDITNLSERLVFRGHVIDVARHLGVGVLDPGFAITADLLEEIASANGVDFRPGDALLVRTGFLGSRSHEWGDYAGGDAPGLHFSTAEWLHSRGIAFLASDTWGVEVRPNGIEAYQPLHLIALVHMGIPFGENFVLDQLAEVCAANSRSTFLLVMAPLPITGASGSPLNPLAIL
jgi:kynurenine formamidase